MGKSNFQIRVEETLLKYINRFLRYVNFSHIPADRREMIVGTFLYLVDEHDLIPDDVPNIGFLDDLAVFLAAAESFVAQGSVPGVVNTEEVAEDMEFVKKNIGMTFGSQIPSIEVIRRKGKTQVDLPDLCQKIRGKYAQLGKVEA